MSSARRTSLGLAAAALRAGDSVDVVGSHGSGKSFYLGELAAELSAVGWKTVFIRGIASLKQFPLAALNLPGILDPAVEARGISSLHQAAGALQARVASRKSVILLDDWDDLDDASWGALDSIRRSHDVPIALSRLRGTNSGQPGRGSHASPVAASYVIELLPLRIDELEAVLKDQLEAPIEARTLNRIYAKTGGHIGLTLALVKAARLENQLVKDRYGVWTSAGELWSSGLSSVLEAQLNGLPTPALDSLEILASVGTVDADTANKLVKPEALELLEERGLVAVLPNAARDLVTVVPPLLVEYFRHESGAARRNRLNDLIHERLGEVESVAGVLAESSRPAENLDGSEALFAGLVLEQAERGTLVAAAEWAAARTPRNATRYVVALAQSQAADTEATVERIFRDTDSSCGSPESRAELIVLQANWAAHVKGQTAEALGLLRAEQPALGVFGRMLDGAAVTILTNLAEIPADAAAKLEITADLPPSVELALLEAQLLVLTSSCRFGEAHRVFDRVCELDPEGKRVMPRVLHGFALLGEGRHTEALRLLTGWFEEARAALDIGGVRSLACVLALCHSQSGDHAALDRLSDTVQAVGGPSAFPANSQVATLAVTTSVVAARRGDLLLVERFVAEARSRGLIDGPMPAQALAWPVSQLLILEGKLEEASDELWNSGEALWARGAYYAGMQSMLVAVEVNPDRQRLAQVQRRLELLPESSSARVQGTYVTALVDQDPEALLVSASALAGMGRYGLAVAACVKAETWFEGRTERVAAARELATQLSSRISTPALDVSRFTELPAVLSHREEQVARLASEGLTNKEIAAQLVLSVRTVDSHMLRILRKLKLVNRRALRDYFDGQ